MEVKKKKKQGSRRGRKRRMCSTENYWGSTWQNYYMGGGRRNMSRSIGRKLAAMEEESICQSKLQSILKDKTTRR